MYTERERERGSFGIKTVVSQYHCGLEQRKDMLACVCVCVVTIIKISINELFYKIYVYI